MNQAGISNLALSRLFFGILFVTTIAVTPWMTIDPINLIKLLTLSVGALGIGLLLLINFRKYLHENAKAALVVAFLFASQLVLVSLFSPFDKSLQFFGTMGRNTGLLFYMALAFLLLGGVAISGFREYQKSISVLVGVGSTSTAYGLIQYLGLDPINWANKYSPIIGFLGNPNFQSSMLGLSAIGALVLLIDKTQSRVIRTFATLLIVAALFIAAASDSQQGLLVFAIGFTTLGFFKIKEIQKKIYTLTYVFVSVAVSLVAIVGFFNKGPLSGLLYQASVTYRGDYWRAGWNMALDHPFFGVGLDAYGDNYRKYRTLEATLRRGPEVVTNAAHNVFIDLAANGGFILLAIYCGFIILAINKIAKFIKSGVKDLYFQGVIAVWVAFLAQSIISINQIGLAVWGWAFTGLIIGWGNNPNKVDQRAYEKKGNLTSSASKNLDPKTLMTVFLGMALGLILSAPPLIASANEKSAMASTQLKRILDSERKWPRDPSRSNQIVRILVANSLNKEALEISTLSTSQFKSNYESWQVLSEIPNVSEVVKEQAFENMKNLDPLNPKLK
jgi:O-antigen ligase